MTILAERDGVTVHVVNTPAMQPMSDLVHHVAFDPSCAWGYELLCETPWGSLDPRFKARVVTEVDAIGRSRHIHLTTDLVDCMTCIVREVQR